jgi:hypothetical protein
MNHKMKFAFLLLLIFLWQPAPAEDDDDESVAPADNKEYRGGTLRLGAFSVGNINTRAYFGPVDIPLRGAIDISEDLGLGDHLVAFRSSFVYRFSKRHAMSIGYYRINLDGIVQLERTIELGDSEFDIGIDVNSSYDEQITKFAYNFIFHDEGRVMLSVAAGVHFSKAQLSMQALGAIPGGTALDEIENRSITAPLPMIGGRLVYRLSSKWKILATSDIFFFNRDSQEGQLNDTHILIEYKASDHFLVGGGINRFSLDLQLLDHDRQWDWSSLHTGVHLYVGYTL